MSAPAHEPCVVVAYDGSPAAIAALRFAVDRAAGRKLFIVHAYDAPADYWGYEHYHELLNLALSRGEKLLQGLSTVEPRLAELDYETELIQGLPAEVVANVATVRGAEEIFLGTRGFGRLRAVLGSVAHELLHLAPCPVTVIPERVVKAAGDNATAAAATAA